MYHEAIFIPALTRVFCYNHTLRLCPPFVCTHICVRTSVNIMDCWKTMTLPVLQIYRWEQKEQMKADITHKYTNKSLMFPFHKNTNFVLLSRWCWALHLSIISVECHRVMVISTLQCTCAICFYLISIPPLRISPRLTTQLFSVFPSVHRLATVPSVLFHHETDGQVPLSQDQEDSIQEGQATAARASSQEYWETCKQGVCVCVWSCVRKYICVLWEIHLFPTYPVCLFAYLWGDCFPV